MEKNLLPAFSPLQPHVLVPPPHLLCHHLILSVLFILSLAALLPKEELSHGFPEPAVMLKL